MKVRLSQTHVFTDCFAKEQEFFPILFREGLPELNLGCSCSQLGFECRRHSTVELYRRDRVRTCSVRLLL